MELLKKGRFPESVHFDVKRYEIDEVCGGETDKNKSVDVSNWLTTLWATKEERLKEFYRRKKFQPSGKRYQWPVRIKKFVAFIILCV